MVICPRCDVEYDKGETTCGACGTPLVFQEDPTPESTEAPQGKRELRQCPKCNMLYEKRTHCLSCGTALVARGASPMKKEPPKTPDHPENRESPLIQSPRKQLETPREETVRPGCRTACETVGSPRRSGNGAVTHELPDDRPEPRRPTREPKAKNKNSEKELQHILEGICPRAAREESLISKPFLVGVIILVVLFVGYFPVKRALVAGPTVTPAISPVTTSSPGPAIRTEVSTEDQETERITGLLENIRQANLREDIDLFMSCYAADFKGREKKKQTILESWKNSDYLDLSFSLKSRALTVDTAKIQVEWLVRTARSATGQLEEGQLLVEALLKKEGEIWKIKEIKTLS